MSPTTDIMPPHPPHTTSIQVVSNYDDSILPPPALSLQNGERFYYVSMESRDMMTTAFDAITQLRLWNYMKSSYAYDSDETTKIGNKIVALGYAYHSGASFSCTMRHMQYIAIHGELAYQNHVTASSE